MGAGRLRNLLRVTLLIVKVPLTITFNYGGVADNPEAWKVYYNKAQFSLTTHTYLGVPVHPRQYCLTGPRLAKLSLRTGSKERSACWLAAARWLRLYLEVLCF